jgi:hypothetical protein
MRGLLQMQALNRPVGFVLVDLSVMCGTKQDQVVITVPLLLRQRAITTGCVGLLSDDVSLLAKSER